MRGVDDADDKGLRLRRRVCSEARHPSCTAEVAKIAIHTVRCGSPHSDIRTTPIRPHSREAAAVTDDPWRADRESHLAGIGLRPYVLQAGAVIPAVLVRGCVATCQARSPRSAIRTGGPGAVCRSAAGGRRGGSRLRHRRRSRRRSSSGLPSRQARAAHAAARPLPPGARRSRNAHARRSFATAAYRRRLDHSPALG